MISLQNFKVSILTILTTLLWSYSKTEEVTIPTPEGFSNFLKMNKGIDEGIRVVDLAANKTTLALFCPTSELQSTIKNGLATNQFALTVDSRSEFRNQTKEQFDLFQLGMIKLYKDKKTDITLNKSLSEITNLLENHFTTNINTSFVHGKIESITNNSITYSGFTKITVKNKTQFSHVISTRCFLNGSIYILTLTAQIGDNEKMPAVKDKYIKWVDEFKKANKKIKIDEVIASATIDSSNRLRAGNFTATFPTTPVRKNITRNGLICYRFETQESPSVCRAEWVPLPKGANYNIENLIKALEDRGKEDGLSSVEVYYNETEFGWKAVMRGSKKVTGRYATYKTEAYIDGNNVFTMMVASESSKFPNRMGSDFLKSFKYSKVSHKGEIERLKAADAASANAQVQPQSLLIQPTATGYSAGRGMEGSKAGEEREFGGIRFCWCPAGTFQMGSPVIEGRDYDVRYKVTLTKGFWLSKHECMQAQWQEVMGSNPSYFKGDGLPVERVSWDDVQDYLKKLNNQTSLSGGWQFRLPTEAQWEYGCRAGTQSEFSFGSLLNGEQANCNGRNPYGTSAKGPSLGKTSRVGSYGGNGWGLHDMHGNVREWCSDWYGLDYREWQHDPTGPDTGSERVFRGGSWSDSAQFCQAAWVFEDSPAHRSKFLGFRVVLSSSPNKLQSK